MEKKDLDQLAKRVVMEKISISQRKEWSWKRSRSDSENSGYGKDLDQLAKRVVMERVSIS
jgi:hypothetical protein